MRRIGMTIQDSLFALADADYKAFHSALIPTVPPERILGVRVPVLRKFAKTLPKEQAEEFLAELPHEFYDENMLHAILLSEVKDFDRCLALVEDFLPHIDNWAVCDCLSPAVFRRHRPRLLPAILRWVESPAEYTCRFGIGMLMRHFLDEDFKAEYLAIPAAVKREEYYVKMMVAWFFATALAKHWDETVVYSEEKRLEPWVHNKAIQKARESYRITPQQKEYLKTLKV